MDEEAEKCLARGARRLGVGVLEGEEANELENTPLIRVVTIVILGPNVEPVVGFGAQSVIACSGVPLEIHAPPDPAFARGGGFDTVAVVQGLVGFAACSDVVEDATALGLADDGAVRAGHEVQRGQVG